MNGYRAVQLRVKGTHRVAFWLRDPVQLVQRCSSSVSARGTLLVRIRILTAP
jgi:hypothetical protein